ncbi:hypothetical protein [Methylobrevis albus]|uniref:Uncharacterized protein n=1 Tax=Methylobrevis albus TaxID=2793297 RepID=A0A931I439_9HYPH|nr:hypothetical protein [Methylobrevis albus]MBH0239089.1 hypothetical protein [Methylobrevis albus]
MSDLSLASSRARTPPWLTLVALGGIAWNLFGAVQFVRAITATPASLVAMGLTPDQAAVMTGQPLWMTLAFALGVAGGLVGSALLLVRARPAREVLGASLGAYAVLWVGDAVHGVFAALGVGQVVILSLVVAIAGGLFAASRHPAARA